LQRHRQRRRQRRSRSVQDRGGELKRRRTLERQSTRRHLVQQHAERPDVTPLVCGAAAQQLRCEIRERSGQRPTAFRGHARPRQGLYLGGRNPARKAEIEYLGVPIGRNHHIRVLQIPVDDAVPMRVFGGLSDLHSVSHDRLGR
jgi:hypothetical protein